MLRVYCVYHEFNRTGMRGVDGTRAPIKPEVVFSSTALRAASPDGGLKLFRQPGWTSGAHAFRRRRRGDGALRKRLRSSASYGLEKSRLRAPRIH
jgi:hypothetical protein